MTNSEESAPNRDELIGAPRTIMVVDDDDDIRFLLAQFLRADGYNVTEAGTAGEAETNAATYPPDLILMDLSMPGTDGLSAIWNIRKLPGMSTVPIIIVSAFDAFDLRAEATAAGCCGYLTKPVEPTELRTAITSALESSR